MVARATKTARRPRRAAVAPSAALVTVEPAVVPTLAKPPAKPRVRRKTVKVPPRMFAMWVVCDNGMKQVATFEYRDRAAADAKLEDMLGRKAGGYFLQLIKEARPDAVPPAA